MNDELRKQAFVSGLSEKLGIRPRALTAILGGALTGLPAAIYGGMTAGDTESATAKALQYGSAGALAGAGAGYLAPLSQEGLLRQLAPGDISEQLKSEKIRDIINRRSRGVLENIADYGWADLFDSATKRQLQQHGWTTENIVKALMRAM